MVPRCPACQCVFSASLLQQSRFGCPRCSKSLAIAHRTRRMKSNSSLSTLAARSNRNTLSPGCLARTSRKLGFPGYEDALSMLQAARCDDELGRLDGYRILAILGHGGMGVVFLGEDVRLGRRVAIKAMLPRLARSEHARARFLREARAAAGLESDHIVSVLHVGDDAGVPFLVMPFLKGETLENRLRHGPSLPLDLVLQVGEEVAIALSVAHASGVLHRDVKPPNVWLEPHAGASSGVRAKLLDFGLAFLTLEKKIRLTQLGDVLGTPGYMAPEQALGHDLDARCDLFSLGCLLYRMATGHAPFAGATAQEVFEASLKTQPVPVEEVNGDLPAGLIDLIESLLAREVEKRPASAEAVAQELRRVRESSRPQERDALYSLVSTPRSTPCALSVSSLYAALDADEPLPSIRRASLCRLVLFLLMLQLIGVILIWGREWLASVDPPNVAVTETCVTTQSNLVRIEVPQSSSFDGSAAASTASQACKAHTQATSNEWLIVP